MWVPSRVAIAIDSPLLVAASVTSATPEPSDSVSSKLGSERPKIDASNDVGFILSSG
jgi:hypothetical protein